MTCDLTTSRRVLIYRFSTWKRPIYRGTKRYIENQKYFSAYSAKRAARLIKSCNYCSIWTKLQFGYESKWPIAIMPYFNPFWRMFSTISMELAFYDAKIIILACNEIVEILIRNKSDFSFNFYYKRTSASFNEFDFTCVHIFQVLN